jgi:hypothetical protein
MKALPFVVLSLLAAPAFAESAAAPAVRTGLTPVDTTKVPHECLMLAQTPAAALVPGPYYAQWISVAECMWQSRMPTVAVTPDPASLKLLADAAAPSLAMLADVASHGDAAAQILAETALGDLYAGMAIRARDSIQGVAPGEAGDRVIKNADLHAQLEPMLAPWLSSAQSAFTLVAQLAGQAPPDVRGMANVALAIRRANVGMTVPIASTK